VETSFVVGCPRYSRHERERSPPPALHDRSTRSTQLLHGGLLKAGVYMVQGRPGAGKTVLTNQVAFHQRREAARAVRHAARGPHERLAAEPRVAELLEADQVPTTSAT